MTSPTCTYCLQNFGVTCQKVDNPWIYKKDWDNENLIKTKLPWHDEDVATFPANHGKQAPAQVLTFAVRQHSM